MKYNIGDRIKINNAGWVVSEHRMGRGRQWTYTLSHEDSDTTMSLNERAMDGLKLSGSMVSSIKEVIIDENR